jgi:hypothetical protein
MTAEPQVTLLITNSIDYLADLLVARLGSERVFRYNTDLWRDYSFCFSADGVEISDPTGRSVTDANIAKVYRRSAMSRPSTSFVLKAWMPGTSPGMTNFAVKPLSLAALSVPL